MYNWSKLFLILGLFLLSSNVFGQFNNVNMGAEIGVGEIQGNSPPITAMSFKLFLDAKTPISESLSFRLGAIYSRKLTYYFPEDRTNRYYPYILSVSLKVFTKKYLTKNLFTEYGAGFILLNDRTFEDTDLWIAGLGFSVSAGLDLREESRGIVWLLGIDYGSTYFSTNAKYYTIDLGVSFYY